MQQRQPRLGDVLDDYCPRERRLTNHVVVAMIGDEVKQTRCATCEADHPFKHARAPRPRRKSEPAALYAQVLAGVTPKKVVHEQEDVGDEEILGVPPAAGIEAAPPPVPEMPPSAPDATDRGLAAQSDHGASEIAEEEDDARGNVEQGPVHRTLIRAQLPRLSGQPPAPRPAPDFTIRQPTGRQDRFRPRQPRAGQGFQGNRSGNGPGHGNGNGNVHGGGPRPQGGGRPPMSSRLTNQQGPGRKRSR